MGCWKAKETDRHLVVRMEMRTGESIRMGWLMAMMMD